MALFTFWRGDVHAAPGTTNNLSIQKEWDTTTLATLMKLEPQAIARRFQEGNEAWVVRLEAEHVSFGWLGRGRVRIGELSREVDVPQGNAYLWNFRTLEAYRGRGYYVQLLRTMVEAEAAISHRLWIISAPENQSSYNGIMKAGFQPVGDLMFDHKNEVVLQAGFVDERTQAGAELIQVPINATAVRPCWRCASKAMKKEAACDCYENQRPCCCNNQGLQANATGGQTANNL
ncbi:hypothetical protein RT717_11600 [Imperialibacter roseus]|uniref:N-acetyltransferase domain-containing protein n=1 Tax=Imperialibacter roseus TaxID=1324217 RepID=A0ABZ0IW59_9BACT|nr:hypothetical protein [Imperialibacter roseus]WOK09283.1 hypothetical protein RT717_11600 [Imperialibacter roseus]